MFFTAAGGRVVTSEVLPSEFSLRHLLLVLPYLHALPKVLERLLLGVDTVLGGFLKAKVKVLSYEILIPNELKDLLLALHPERLEEGHH